MSDTAQAPTKPPTQVAGVTGIAAEKIEMNEAPANALPWPFIASLPPFQMYAVEKMRNTSGKDSQAHAEDFIRAMGGGQDLFNAYVDWHAAKGYWPGESPLGHIKVEESKC